MDERIPRRLDKFLADSRIGSRVHIESLAACDAIAFNGQPESDLRRLVDPTSDVIEVDGQPAQLSPPRIHALLHKPAGVVTTMADPQGRPCIADLVPADWLGRVGVVGRLDKPTTGALLITDDGDLSHLLTDPAFHVWKRYVLTLVGDIEAADPRLEQLRAGVMLGDTLTAPARCGLVPDSGRDGKGGKRLTDAWIEVREGRFRQVRRMANTVGFRVARLHRVAIGPLLLGDLEQGRWRALQSAEVDGLYEAAGGRDAPTRGARKALIRRLEAGELSVPDVDRVRRYLREFET